MTVEPDNKEAKVPGIEEQASIKTVKDDFSKKKDFDLTLKQEITD